ncbi:MAG: flagellar hook-associated protein FlgK [Brevundimonas sp.]
MSLNLIMNTATSGMMTAQGQLRVISDNVANVNTPGYVRKVGEQQALTTQGVGSGVELARVRLATDRFLQAASFNAGAEAARQGVRYELYDRVQSLFGNPSGGADFFSQVDGVFSAFAVAAEDPVSSPRRQEALFRAQTLFDEAARIQSQIQAVREDADGRLKSAVDGANLLLEQIEALNVEISRATVSGADASGAESAQASLIGELSQIMDLRLSPRSQGGVTVRTNAGVMLAGDGYATLEYQRAGAVNSESAFSDVWVTEPRGTKRALAESITSGEIKGLLELRNVEAPAAAERLAELVARVADELNRAHNANSAAPAPSTLTGRNVGQSFDAAIAGFTGTSNIAVVNPQGVVQTQVEVVFSGGAMTINGTAATPATFLTVLNAELGGQATAAFTNGVLSLATGSANGVVITDDPTSPSSKTGRGFSHFFGLNDLVSTDRMALYDTGLTGLSPHGFTPGETIKFRFTGDTGARLRDIEVTVPPGGAVDDMIAALNDPNTGVGYYGSFSLDAAGALNFTPSRTPAPQMSILEDRTTQIPSGVSLTELFGIGGGVRSSRADGFSIRADIAADPSRLGLAQLDLNAAPGSQALSSGDGRGALLLADAGQRAAAFHAAGGAQGGAISISRYASEMAGDIGARASIARDRRDAALTLQQEARARQTAEEGVNMDEELVLLTTYQQAFNASARMIQAASDMYDTLMGMMR